MPETVLVTGGSGYVAGWCIVGLLQRGYHVRTTVRGQGKEQAVSEAVATRADTGGRLEFVIADLTADGGWDDAVTCGRSLVAHGAV